MTWGKCIVCLLFGWLGVHKFMEKKIGMGFLYLFTLGLFGIGWLVDIVRYFYSAFRHSKVFGKITAGILSVLVILGLVVGGSDETPADQTAVYLTASPTVVIEPTVTIESTAAPEPTETAEPTATIKPTAEATCTVEANVTAKPTVMVNVTQTVAPNNTARSTAVVPPTHTVEETVTIKPTANTDSFLLKRGDKSEDVRLLQMRLIKLGFLHGAADGDFGQKTERAVLEYQKAAGLTESGECDVETYNHMQSEVAAVAPTAKPTVKPTKKPTAGTSSDSSDDTSTHIAYIASKNSEVFHEPYCDSVDDMKESNKRYFSSREEAVKSGRRPCKKCNP